MARALNRLTALKVARAKKPGMLADGGSLYLRIAPGGSRQWIFRYVTNGRLRDMSIGPAHTLTLAEARERATEARKLRLDGIDPIEHKRARKAALRAADARTITFRECCEAYLRSHDASWTSARHRAQWRSTLAQLYPGLGAMPVQAIDTPLVLRALKPIWEKTPVTASRLRGRVEAVLGWATVHHYRAGDNPAKWGGLLEHALPAPGKVARVEHHSALPYAQIAEFMTKVRNDTSVTARALEFIVLTAARSGEAVGSTWDEIDFDAKVWVVPKRRMKAGREHRVPLSDAAMRVLRAMRAIRQSPYIFPGASAGKPIRGGTVWWLANQLAGVSVHGLRSSFRDWSSEQTDFPREVCEQALAHAIPNAVEAAYRRGDLFDKRRKLMEAWAEFCGKPTASGRVVSIVGRRGGDDLAKAKILLAWATRVYGPDEEADEYTRDEYNRFLKMGCKIAGIEIETVGRVSVEEVVATMLAEDREAARAAQVPPKRGRPPTPHRHLWITGSIEAYRGTGLRRKAAEIRAAREWDLHPSTIGKVYKVNKELKPISKEMRAIFDRDSKEGIDEAIRQFRESGRNGE